jgi:hypothetical protein
MVVVLRQNLTEQVGSTRQQRDSEDSIDESLSSSFDAIFIVMSLLYARVEPGGHIERVGLSLSEPFITDEPSELGYYGFGRTLLHH